MATRNNPSSNSSSDSLPSSSRERIDVSAQTRAHPLFGMLDYLVRKSHTTNQRVDNQLTNMENKLNSVAEVQKELKQMLEKYEEQTFSIERTPYQVF